MLSAFYIALRFVHFTALMVLSGSAVNGVLLAPQGFKLRLARQLRAQWLPAAWLSLLSACLLFVTQAGLMGGGWRDVISPDTWLAVLSTRFGSLWIWPLLLAIVTLMVVHIGPRALQGLLLLLSAAQLMVVARVGHAAMHEGATGVLQRINMLFIC